MQREARRDRCALSPIYGNQTGRREEECKFIKVYKRRRKQERTIVARGSEKCAFTHRRPILPARSAPFDVLSLNQDVALNTDAEKSVGKGLEAGAEAVGGAVPTTHSSVELAVCPERRGFNVRESSAFLVWEGVWFVQLKTRTNSGVSGPILSR